MAINFPSTAGQATDGSYTYTVAGITYSWDGTSWSAAGAGASATDRTLFSVTQNAVGTAALSYTSATGVFSYTPPDLSSYLTAEADTLTTVTGRGSATTNSITVGGLTVDGAGDTVGKLDITDQGSYSQIQFYNNTGVAKVALKGVADNLYIEGGAGNIRLHTYALFYTNGDVTLNNGGNGNTTIGGSLTAGGLTYPTTNGTSGDVLTSDGAGNVSWSTPSGLQTRTTAQVTVSATQDVAVNTQITTPNGYALLAIGTSHAAWVTLYMDTNSRTLDAGRGETSDPVPGSGVLAEIITTGSATQYITPGAFCFNTASNNTTYIKAVGKAAGTVNLTITLTYIQLEG